MNSLPATLRRQPLWAGGAAFVGQGRPFVGRLRRRFEYEYEYEYEYEGTSGRTQDS